MTMEEQISLLKNLESYATVENVTLRLLVNDSIPGSAVSNLADMVMHHHSYTELFVCGGGEIFIDTETGPVHLGPGDAAIIPSQFKHNKRPSGTPAVWHTLGFICVRHPAKDCRDLYQRFDNLCQGGCVRTWRNMPALYDLVTHIIGVTSRKSDFLPALELAEVLSLMAEKKPGRLSAGETLPSFPSDSQDSDIRRMAVLDYLINSCFMTDFSDVDIARQLFISERQLSRIVQKWYGTTLRRAIVKKRIVTAEQLLRLTNQPAEKIGYTVGFQSKSTFFREFRKMYGKTPTEYRRNNE